MTLQSHPYHYFFIIVLVTLGHLFGGLKGAEIALVCILSLLIVLVWIIKFYEWWQERKYRRARNW